MSRFLELQPRSSVLIAAEREGRAGRGSSEFFPAPGSGAARPERVRAGLWRGRGSRVRAGSDAEGMALRLCVGDHERAAAGAANRGGPGLALSGGAACGQLGVERVSSSARAGAERCVHAGGGDGARAGPGEVGDGGAGFDAHPGECVGERIDTEPRLRGERAKIRRQIRRWQKGCETGDPDEGAGPEWEWRNWKKGWRNYPGGWSGYARAEKRSCRRATRRRDFCGSGADVRWVTRRRWR